MEMVAGGRISPDGGRSGHTHGDMKPPTQAQVDAIYTAATLADLKTALLSWFHDNGLDHTPVG